MDKMSEYVVKYAKHNTLILEEHVEEFKRFLFDLSIGFLRSTGSSCLSR